MDLWDAVALILAAGIIVAATPMAMSTAMTKTTYGLYTSIATFLFVVGFARPVIRMAREGYPSILSVCVTVTIVFVLFLAGFYWSYFLIVGTLAAGGQPTSKLLDLPTPMLAVWAAGLGWYVTFQLGRRNQRTSHAVALVLGTRTNAEFQKNAVRCRRWFPDAASLKDVDTWLFGIDAVKSAREKLDKDDKSTVTALNHAHGIQALKYMLNYYEFVAVGIAAGEFDEEMVYEAIGEHLIRLYERGARVRDWLRDPDGGKEPLAWCHLDTLVSRWRPLRQADYAVIIANGTT